MSQMEAMKFLAKEQENSTMTMFIREVASLVLQQ